MCDIDYCDIIQLQAYAMTLSMTPRITTDYIAKGARAEDFPDHYYKAHGVYIAVLLYFIQIVPFVILSIVSIIVNYMHICKKDLEETDLKNFWDELIRSEKGQANTASTAAICILLILYILALNCTALGYGLQTDDSNYPDIVSTLPILTFTFNLIIIASYVVCMLILLLYCQKSRCTNTCKKCKKCKKCISNCIKCISNCTKKCCSDCTKNCTDWKCLCFIFLVEGAVLSLSLNIQYVLIAFATDPIYAGTILVYYGICFFVLFMTFRFTYNYLYPDSILEKVGFMVLCGFLVVGTLVMTGIFLAYIPINRSIEAGSNAVSVIYTGAIGVIGTVVGFSVASIKWNTKPSPQKTATTAYTRLNNQPVEET